MKRSIKEYQRASAACAAHAREQVAYLVAAARAFHEANHRWPRILPELTAFAFQNKLPLDELAFSEATFASMSDGNLQIQYEINCVRFDMADQKLTQRGTLNIKPR